MEKYFDVMQLCPLFAGIDRADLSAMLSCLGAKISFFGKNQTIFSEGEAAKYVGIVLSGSVRIIRDDYYGNRSIVALIGPAQLFGETFACAGVGALPVSAVADRDSTVMLADCRRILASCSSACDFHARLIGNLLQVLAGKNLILNQKIEFISKRSTREKLMAYLLSQAKLHGCGEFTIPYDRQALADYLEVERSAMSAELGRMRRDGLIDTKRNWFKIL